MAHYTHLIWDFNGTVLDDVQLGIDCVNPMLAVRGLPTIPDVDTYRTVFGFPIKEYYRRLGFDFDREDYETVLAPEWVAHYLAGEPSCPLMPGAREVIDTVAQWQIPQLMLSATKLEQLKCQLARVGLIDAFEEVLGLDNIHAQSKTHLAIAWQAAHPDARPLFVGDTEHDAAVARAIGADCLLYAGGHQARASLSACGYPVIDHIEEILSYLAPCPSSQSVQDNSSNPRSMANE